MPRNSITNEAGFDGVPDVANAAIALTTGGTIPCTTDVVLINPAAAVTGVIIQKGLFNGQELIVSNLAAAANSATMAAAATSNVADGVSDVLPGLSARAWIWVAQTAAWYVEK